MKSKLLRTILMGLCTVLLLTACGAGNQGILSDFNRKIAEKFFITHHFAKWRKAQLEKVPAVELTTFAPPMYE